MVKRKNDFGEPDPKVQKTENGFVKKWLVDFKWLQYDEEKNKMFCMWCKRHNVPNKFATVGSSNFKRSTLNDHVKSEDHRTAVNLNATAEKKLLTNIFSARNAKQDTAMCHLINTAYTVAKENMPIAKYESLCKLQIKNGATLTSSMYQDTESCFRFIDIISDLIEEEVLIDIKNSPTLGIMIDESTDLSTEKHLILYMSYIKDCQLQVKYVKLLHLSSCDASTITANLIAFFNIHGIATEKIFGFGSDGASVMLGREGGVATLLKENCPHLTETHCAAHRLALACVNIADVIREIRYFESIISALYSYFKRSPTNMANLQMFQELLDDPKLKPKAIHKVRWLSMSESINTVRRSYKSLVHVTADNSDSDIIASSLHSNLTTYKFVFLLHLFSDIFGSVAILSRTLQKSGISYSTVQTAISSFKSNLEASYLSDNVNYGPHLDQFLESTSDTATFQGIDLKSDINDDKLKECATKTAKVLLENIEQRFPDMDLLSGFQILDPTNFPDKKDLNSYGRKELSVLCTKYESVLDTDEIISEFHSYKTFVSDNYGSLSAENILKILKESDSYPNIVKLLEISLVLPVSSVDCERGFSVQNQIKTRTRCSISVAHLDQLMRIMILGPSIETYDPTPALTRWRKAGDRHIYSKNGQSRIVNV